MKSRGADWTEEEDEALCAAASAAEARALLPHRCVGSIYHRRHRLIHQGARVLPWKRGRSAPVDPAAIEAALKRMTRASAAPPSPSQRDMPAKRRCLKCGEMFASRNCGNRICKQCLPAVNAAIVGMGA